MTGKIHAAQIRNIMQSPRTFIIISGPLTNDWENVAHREETEPSERYAVSFYLHLSLETVFPALKLTQN